MENNKSLDSKALFNEAINLINGGSLSAATEVCRKAIAENPGDVSLTALLGAVLLKTREPEEAEKYFLKIDELGGVVPAIEDGYFQREIAKAASDYQRKVDSKERVVVGVNEFVNKNEEIEIPILTISGNAQKQQSYNLKKMRESRDTKILQKSLDEVTQACKNGNNLMPPIINAARSLATLGEIVRAMKPHFGEWVEGSVF